MRENGTAGPAPAARPAEGCRRACRRIVPNVLDRAVRGPAPNQKWIADFTYIWTAEGWLYVAAVIDLFSRRVVGWSMNAEHDGPTRHRRAHHGDLAARQARQPAASFRSGQPIYQRAVPAPDGRPRHHLLDEPVGQRLGQCGDGELLLLAQDRANGPQGLPNERRRQGRCVRLHRALLQPEATALDTGLSQPRRVREASWD